MKQWVRVLGKRHHVGVRSILFMLAILVWALFTTPTRAQDQNDDGLGSILNGPGNVGNSNGQQTTNQSGSQGYNEQPNGIQSRSQSTSGADLQSNPDSQANSPFGNNSANLDQYWQQQRLRNLPPDPPTEFQKLVASSIGKMLPIYGARLFRNTPSTFSPLDRVPVTPDYVVGPGDELLIQIWGQVRLNSHFTVDRTGNIYVPQVGTIHVAGLSFGQLADHLKDQVGKNFRNFDLNVNMGQLRSIQIFVVGQARSPGSYTVSSLSTLVDALFVTGGPTPQGSMRHIQVKREGKTVTDFDLYDLLEKGDKSNDIALLPGDVIYIPPVGAQVAVAGSVNNPAIYELKSADATTVDQVLTLAANAANTASNQTVRLERLDAHQMRSVTDLNLSAAGRDQILRDGDVLELIPIVAQYSNGVTLRGNVANPGRYAWHAGMHVGDLFPDKSALITRDYWLKQGQLGKPVLTYIPVCPPLAYRNNATQLYGSDPTGSGNETAKNGASNNNSASSYNRSQSAPQYNSRTMDQPAQESSWTDQSDGGGCINLPENTTYPAEAPGNYQQSNLPNRSAEPGQTTDQSNQPRSTSAGTAAGGSATALVGSDASGFRPRNEVKLSEPDIDWTYAVIERQDKSTLTTSLIPFNLGHLVLDKDKSQDVALQPGDVVTIFSKADFRVPQSQQTRLVHLEGEFLSAGVYSVLPGETLKDLVQRAGGFTPDAYLYGSEFTRESTRRIQQQRLNEYVNQIALQAGTNSANNASRSVSALDTAAAAAMASQSQSVISSLRDARSTGRIVLELKPDSNQVDQLPAIPLEDGDRFIVPHVPSTVSVAGAVYNANSFIYDHQRRLKDYLQLAGGSNRDADRRSTYVIRADGSVLSRRQVSTWRKDSFDDLRIYPGDTVVIPLNLSKGASLRTIVDVAQIVGQFGVAIAAANLVF